MKNPGLDEAQAGIKIAGRNINNLRYADDTTLMAEAKRNFTHLLSVALFANIFAHSQGGLFVLFMVSFAVQKLLSLIRSHLFTFVFILIFITLGGGSKKILLQIMSESILPMISSRSFMVFYV